VFREEDVLRFVVRCRERNAGDSAVDLDTSTSTEIANLPTFNDISWHPIEHSCSSTDDGIAYIINYLLNDNYCYHLSINNFVMKYLLLTLAVGF